MQFIDACNLLANYLPTFHKLLSSNVISLQNKRALTRLSKSNGAYGRLETACRINSDIGNAILVDFSAIGVGCVCGGGWGVEGGLFLL